MWKSRMPLLCVGLVLHAGVAFAEDEIEEVVVVGTQIKGAQISDALPVSILSETDIEALGVNSGDELLEYVAEQGQNFFSEAEASNVNSARGDIGAYNLRNVGTGNTLVLLNGRRMVNAASYQTELVGGSFVPVNTVNSQALPVTGLRRLEILKDGASAIYGADAVAGVVNYALQDDFEGLSVSVRYDDYDNIPRNDGRLTIKWGSDFNEGRTNVGAFLNYLDRDRVRARDDERWANSDFRSRTPAPFNDNTTFRNDSINSQFGQFDIRGSISGTGLSGNVTDSSGEFEVFPLGDARCEFTINTEVCGAVDGNGPIRYNFNSVQDIMSEVQRLNVFGYVTHEISDDLEFFGDFTWYNSESEKDNEQATRLSSVAKHRIAPDAFYNPFGPCGSPNRLDAVFAAAGATVPCTGLTLELDNYRAGQTVRVVDVEGDVYRIVGGLRGAWGEWDWEGAVLYSKAERTDITRDRISNILLQEALNDTTAAGFNPFSPTIEGSNVSRVLVDVKRENEQELTSFDFKMSNANIFELPAGPVGIVAGFEYRDESFSDDRDPRLDGTIAFTDNAGTTFPFISDVVGSSPTSDSSGDRKVTSLFTELQVPILENLDAQFALRYEDFDDVGSTTVGKVAFGYRFVDQILFRASWSEAFRAPNLVTVNESRVVRTNTLDDAICFVADPGETELDCRFGIQRSAIGSASLEPETSENYSVGIVIEPTDNFTLTVDVWEIQKEDSIGLFGENNHLVADAILRIANGNNNCAAFVGNPAVVRDDPANLSADETAQYVNAGLCPAGTVIRVDDSYANLDERTIRGHDIGIYWNYDTKWGNFDLRYNGTWLDEFEQIPGARTAALITAIGTGAFPANIQIGGFGNLVGEDGNPERKDTTRLTWTRGDWRVAATSLHYSEFNQNLSDGRDFKIDSMTTYNMNISYSFDLFDGVASRARLGINNVTDERAPLADDTFGYFSDQHRDLGRYYYLDLQFKLF